MAYLAASALNRNNRRSTSTASGPSEPSRKDQYLATIADDLQRGDAANFFTHTSQFFSEFRSVYSREQMVNKILDLNPMGYAIIHGNPMLVDTVLKLFPEHELNRNGLFQIQYFNNQFNKYISDFPPEVDGKSYRAVADIVIKKSSDPAKVAQYKQIKKLLIRSGAKPKTHFGKIVFPEDQVDVDFYNSSRTRVAGRNARTHKRKVSKTIRSTRRRRQTKRR